MKVWQSEAIGVHQGEHHSSGHKCEKVEGKNLDCVNYENLPLPDVGATHIQD